MYKVTYLQTFPQGRNLAQGDIAHIVILTGECSDE